MVTKNRNTKLSLGKIGNSVYLLKKCKTSSIVKFTGSKKTAFSLFSALSSLLALFLHIFYVNARTCYPQSQRSHRKGNAFSSSFLGHSSTFSLGDASWLSFGSKSTPVEGKPSLCNWDFPDTKEGELMERENVELNKVTNEHISPSDTFNSNSEYGPNFSEF